MTLVRANALGSGGHFLFPLRNKLDTFPIVRCKDEAKWGTYGTKDTILEICAALAPATESGQPYRTRLNPPPAPRLWRILPHSGSLVDGAFFIHDNDFTG
jgi:hypothetical protein